MTLGEFRKETADLPDNLELFVDERKTEERYGLVNSTYLKKINMMDGESLKAPLQVLIIDEE